MPRKVQWGQTPTFETDAVYAQQNAVQMGTPGLNCQPGGFWHNGSHTAVMDNTFGTPSRASPQVSQRRLNKLGLLNTA